MRKPYFLPGGEIGCIMIHGFGGSPGEMAGLGEYLHGQGYSIGGVLLKGHGTSPEDLAKTDWSDWYDSVAQTVEELHHHGCKKFWAVGLSLGGALSLYAGANGLVDGVVSLAAPTGLADWRVRFVSLVKYFKPYMEIELAPERKALDQEMGRFSYSRLPLAAIENLYNFITVTRKALPLIQVPTLVVHSLKDEVIAKESGKYIYEQISSPHKEILELKRSGHMVTEDVEKDLVWQKVAEFLQKY